MLKLMSLSSELPLLAFTSTYYITCPLYERLDHHVDIDVKAAITITAFVAQQGRNSWLADGVNTILGVDATEDEGNARALQIN